MVKGKNNLGSLTTLKGVGPSVAARCARLGIHAVEDLFFLLPLRYEDRTKIVPFGALEPGRRALVEGEVELAEIAFRGRRVLLVRLHDGSGSLTLRFFHFSDNQRRALKRGTRLRCFGEARKGQGGMEMVHPEYRAVSQESGAPPPVLTPVYPTTEGLGQQRIRNLVTQALARLESQGLPDPLEQAGASPSLSLEAAIRLVHRPPADDDVEVLQNRRHPAHRRLALEELVAHRLSLLSLRAGQRQGHGTPVAQNQTAQGFLASLPFRLTGAQQRALDDIFGDIAQAVPMLRLVQGDVGSGKTVVAAAAAAQVAGAGHQTAIMAPTELLAEQHFHNFVNWLEPLGISVAWLSGSVTGQARHATLQGIAMGDAKVIVGTHALFQEQVKFQDLVLVVVDEQHRFGVHQRLKLQGKGEVGSRRPHQLTMTATPIPRTLTMTVYADLDCSVIDELPPGREPIKTVVMPQDRRTELVDRVRKLCESGAQAYWVCPLIEESDHIESEAAEEIHATLATSLPSLSVGLVHGRMRAREKEAVMQRFKAAEIQLLVATTVIEVGVDVPNATLMVIENAERMGLSQLHQLRGRVGRGGGASNCILLYRAPLGELAKARLGVMRDTQDGFIVAQKDLELRGPGELLGTRQTGLMQLRIADLLRDADLLDQVTDLSEKVLARGDGDVLVRRWISGREEYGKV